MQITATLQPPMLFLDECVAADSLDVEIGDLTMVPAAPSPGVEETKMNQAMVNMVNSRCQSRVSWGPTSFHSAPRESVESDIDSDDSVGRRSTSSTSTSSDRSDDSDNSARRSLVAQRVERRKRREDRVQRFLQKNGFTGVNDASNSDKLRPIHVAAKCGDHGMIRLLLTANTDASVKTSQGWTALDFARELPKCETQLHVIELLRSREKTMAMREFRKMVG